MRCSSIFRQSICHLLLSQLLVVEGRWRRWFILFAYCSLSLSFVCFEQWHMLLRTVARELSYRHLCPRNCLDKRWQFCQFLRALVDWDVGCRRRDCCLHWPKCKQVLLQAVVICHVVKSFLSMTLVVDFNLSVLLAIYVWLVSVSWTVCYLGRCRRVGICSTSNSHLTVL